MKSRVIASLVAASSFGFVAAAEQIQAIDQTGEALAWTVAAYGSCEDVDQLQIDFKREATTLESDFNDVIGALTILETATNVCGMKQTFASDMKQLATVDMASFEAKVMAFADPIAPVFAAQEPEGAGQSAIKVISEAANTPPPLSSDAPSQESDYQ
jgi:hypothetical protein